MIIYGEKVLNLIKEFESWSSKPYHGKADADNVFTIGWGTTVYPNGKKVQLTDREITIEQGNAYLKYWLDKAVKVIDPFLRDDLTENQFAAMLSFGYNCGVGALQTSTLLKRVQANKNDPTIKDAFLMWVHGEGGKVVPGLVNRRTKEAQLYFQL